MVSNEDKMLTTEQLGHALRVAYWADDDEGQDFLQAELHRRRHGPFTLAEAVASGRPFKRQSWAPWRWASGIIDEDVGAYFFGPSNSYEQCDYGAVLLGDITAADYILKPVDNTEETKESKKP